MRKYCVVIVLVVVCYMYPTRLCVCVCMCEWWRREWVELIFAKSKKYFVLLRNFLNFVSVIILPVHASAAEFHHLFCVSVTKILDKS